MISPLKLIEEKYLESDSWLLDITFSVPVHIFLFFLFFPICACFLWSRRAVKLWFSRGGSTMPCRGSMRCWQQHRDGLQPRGQCHPLLSRGRGFGAGEHGWGKFSKCFQSGVQRKPPLPVVYCFWGHPTSQSRPSQGWGEEEAFDSYRIDSVYWN